MTAIITLIVFNWLIPIQPMSILICTSKFVTVWFATVGLNHSDQFIQQPHINTDQPKRNEYKIEVWIHISLKSVTTKITKPTSFVPKFKIRFQSIVKYWNKLHTSFETHIVCHTHVETESCERKFNGRFDWVLSTICYFIHRKIIASSLPISKVITLDILICCVQHKSNYTEICLPPEVA